jgi:solute carrier family 25 phosphate transporter 3
MAKFLFFEKIVQLFYTHVFPDPKETYAQTTQLGVTFASGYLAGVVCAVVSHPADTVVSLMGKPANKGKSIGAIASETGIVTLATKGLGTRVLMIGTLTGAWILYCFEITDQFVYQGFQWWIYDSFKASMGLGTTGGK